MKLDALKVGKYFNMPLNSKLWLTMLECSLPLSITYKPSVEESELVYVYVKDIHIEDTNAEVDIS